jgi:hypothetical protein
MIEKNPSGPLDAMPHVIEEIIRTMRLGERILHLDLLQQPTEAYVPETETEPPQVDFVKLAHEAVADGLFRPHPRIPHDELHINMMPQELLDTPYLNGPAYIMLGGDVPVKAMEGVRGGFIRANRLVLKPSLVGAYFNRRFASEQPLLSPGIINKINAFDASYYHITSTEAPSDDIAFQTTVNRSRTDRNLYTPAEKLAAVELAAERPELVVALSTYQGTIIDYLCELGVALDRETTRGNLDLMQSELVLFSGYINEWRTNNFHHEILPAVAIFLHNARIKEPGKHDDDHLTVGLLHEAVDFVIQNGGFRKHVTVPAHAAADGKERTNKFVCPAANIIREHLVDGRLLHQLYQYFRDEITDGNSLVLSMAHGVRQEAKRNNPGWFSYPGDDFFD